MTSEHIPPVPTPAASFPARAGNIVTPWIDGLPFYSRLYDAFQDAQHSIWFVVSFIHRDFCFPQGPSFWQVLREAHERGIDVRVLFWHNPHFFNTGHLFQGDAADREQLQAEGASWRARWASSGEAPSGHCHHHKFWLVDVGTPNEIGFVGGMTWGKTTLDTPAHTSLRFGRHDISSELQGPALRDVADVFVAHWNHAGHDLNAPPPWPDANDRAQMVTPGQRTAPLVAGYQAQLARSIRPNDAGPPAGEDSLFQQYISAFGAAKRSIYIENQHPGEGALLEALEAALVRGVEVLMVVPGTPMRAIYEERKRVTAFQANPQSKSPPRYLRAFAALERLNAHAHFHMVALATSASPDDQYKEIYVHAKVCIVDAVWVTCGSANLVDLSFHRDHTELNLSWWHPTSARLMLKDLIEEHTHANLDPASAEVGWLQMMTNLAAQNTERRKRGNPLQGHAYALNAATYPLSL